MKIGKQEINLTFKGHDIPKYYLRRPEGIYLLCGHVSCNLSNIQCENCAFNHVYRDNYTIKESEKLLILIKEIYNKYNK